MSTETDQFTEHSPSDAADDAPPLPLHRRARPRDRAALAGPLGRRRHVRDAEPGRPARPTPTPWPPRGDKLFVLDMFPYPSGTGLHVGHPLGFTGTDVYSRYQRMAGRNVLYTMGFDAFGLPAEQFAVQTGQHPAITTAENVATYRDAAAPARAEPRPAPLDRDDRPRLLPLDAVDLRPHLRLVVRPRATAPDGGTGRARPIAELIAEFEAGTRELDDGRPWSSLTAAERADVIDAHRLAYVADAPVNWCPGLGTVVANEEVTADGRSDRGNFPVFKRNMRQWMMRITAYADRLLDDLDRLDWTDSLKTMQRNWIGRSTGARVDFDSPAGPITRLHDATRHAVRRHVHGARARAPAGRRPDDVAAGRRRSSSTAGRPSAARTSTARTRTATKTGVFTGSLRHQPGHRPGHPDLDRRLRADGLRHRGDHGRAVRRPARLRVRPVFGLDIPPIQQPPDEWFAAHRIEPTLDTRRWPEAFIGDAPYVNSSNRDVVLDGIDVGRRRHRHDQRLAGGERRRRGDDHLQAARLAVQPPALLGRAVPDRLRRRRPPPRAARRRCCR